MGSEVARDAVKIEHEDTDALVIALSGHLNNIGALKRFAFVDFAEKLPANRIYTKDLHRSWYHKGIEGVSSNILDTAEFFVDQIGAMGAKKVALIGGSSSGYAAVLFGLLVNADFVYSMVPQTFLDGRNRSKAGDERWDRAIDAGEEYFQEEFLDLKQVFDMCPDTKTKFRIYVADCDELDRKHAEHIESCQGVTLKVFEGSELGHEFPKLASYSTHASAAIQMVFRMKRDNYLVKEIAKDLDITPVLS